MKNKQSSSLLRAFQILNKQELAYVTKNAFIKIFQIKDPDDFPRIIQWTSQRKLWIYDCTSFARQLKHNIHKDAAMIRDINSKSITNQLSYGEIKQVPGSHNYIEIFHYKHKLTPKDKYTVQEAAARIRKYRGTYKLKPNLSPTAPVYLVPNKTELWKNKVIFVSDLKKKLKIRSDLTWQSKPKSNRH